MGLTDLFSWVLGRSLTAGVVIVLVCLVRLLLKRAPKIYSYLLWAVVLLRLICPLSLDAAFSLLPQQLSGAEAVEQWRGDYAGGTVIIHQGHEGYDQALEAGIQPIPAGEGGHYVVTAPDGVSQPATVETRVLPKLALVWLLGMGAMALYSLCAYGMLRRRLRAAVPVEKGVFQAPGLRTAFVLGLLRPAVYLPEGLTERERQLILRHERHHIRRGDQIWKALGFAAVSLHWFNPLVWLAFVLACRDMELSCDEAVLRKLSGAGRKAYATALLEMTVGHSMLHSTPLAFGEGDTKGRIRNLVRWKKPALWTIVVCAVLCAAAAVCLLTDPVREPEQEVYLIPDRQQEVLRESVPAGEGDVVVTVDFRRTDAPTALEVEVLYLPESSTRWATTRTERLELQQSAQFQIPSGCTYVVMATSTQGRSGYAALTVTTGAAPDAGTPRQAWGIAMYTEDVTRTGAAVLFSDVEKVLEEGDALQCGWDLTLERLEDGTWRTVEPLDGAEDGTSAEVVPVIDGTAMLRTWEGRFGALPDGHYRMGKELTRIRADHTTQTQTLYAEFDIPGSIRTRSVPLEAMPAPEDYSQEEAMLDGFVVCTDGQLRENGQVLEDFAASCSRGEAGTVRLVNWHYGDESTYTAFDLLFDGSVYILSWLEDGQLQSRSYAHLRFFSGPKERVNMDYDAYTRWVLVNDDDVTWQELYDGLVSAQAEAYIDHFTLCSTLIYYPQTVELPASIVRAELTFQGQSPVTATDPQALEDIRSMFAAGEVLGYEPATHSIGVGLDLLLTDADGGTVRLELDPDGDLCRMDGAYIFYGAYEEPEYVYRLWGYLGLDQWPEAVYAACSNALRPMA